MVCQLWDWRALVHFNLRRGRNKKFKPLSSILEARPMIFVQNNNEVKNWISASDERAVPPAFSVHAFHVIQYDHLFSQPPLWPLWGVKNFSNWTVSNKFILGTLLKGLFQSLTFLEPVISAKCSGLSSQAANLAWQSCPLVSQWETWSPKWSLMQQTAEWRWDPRDTV